MMVSVSQTKTGREEAVEFLVSSPSLEQMANFLFSEVIDERISFLLEQNRNSRISPEEEAELDQFLQIEQFMTMLKLRALEKLEQAKEA